MPAEGGVVLAVASVISVVPSCIDAAPGTVAVVANYSASG
jgi:hypothetical protein